MREDGTLRKLTTLTMAAALLTACDSAPPPAEPEPTASATPEPTASPISILRETPSPVVEDLLPDEPFEAVVPFAKGGIALSDAANEAIAKIVASEQFKLGGKITLRGHTDSVGYDEANLRASRKRAQAIANELEKSGASIDNIEIIAMGEQRPAAPNAKLDGTPDEEGRAKNRRVEVSVAPPESEVEEKTVDGDQGTDETAEDSTP
ncbi:OmpA family protein [Croceicoccus bisphenolivorans]|uniref:OmpA family protein n=1 Tax=Croceicoccus bisphenolivorans TaxID=1783232 RepID=UPI0009EE712E|nr:OmpA family protein [Croceicoccus bisphenolivorans]